MPRIIAVANQKGGVGKTSMAVNLGAALAETGAKVLLVDLDPRADLSGYLGVSLPAEASSVYDALFDASVPLAEVVVATSAPNLELAPATIDLAGGEMVMMQRPAEQRHTVVADALKSLKSAHDYVIMDSPPGLQLLAIAALVAADEVLVPQQCSFLALHGLRQLAQSVERVQQDLNPKLRICGIVMTMQDRRTIHNRQVIEMVREGFGDLVMDTVIPTTVRMQEAAAAGEPITAYDPSGAAAVAYRELAKEVIARA